MDGSRLQMSCTNVLHSSTLYVQRYVLQLCFHFIFQLTLCVSDKIDHHHDTASLDFIVPLCIGCDVLLSGLVQRRSVKVS